MATPNMNLTLPLVSQTPGPTWASQINGDLTLIDSHDHTFGKGAPITPAAININTDLDFNSHSAIGLQSLQLEDQLSLTTPNTIYSVGGNLYFNDGTSTVIPITTGGSVAGSSGTITGLPSGTASASFNAGTFTFDQSTNTGAIISAATLKVRTTTTSTSSVDITNPSSLANYVLNLPAGLPATTSFVTATVSGSTAQLVFSTQTGYVTRTMQAAVGQQINANTSSVLTTSTTFDNLLSSITITTTGRPVVIGLTADSAANVGSILFSRLSGGTDGAGDLGLAVNSTTATVGLQKFEFAFNASNNFRYPLSSYYVFWTPSAGTYTIQLKGRVIAAAGNYGAGQLNLINARLFAYEL